MGKLAKLGEKTVLTLAICMLLLSILQMQIGANASSIGTQESKPLQTIFDPISTSEGNPLMLSENAYSLDMWGFPKAGLFFPKTDYARLRFIVYLSTSTGYFHIHINQIKDIYLRDFTVYLDGTQIYHTVIGDSGFDGNVNYSTSVGTHTLALEVAWGYYAEYSWKLTKLEIYNGRIDALYFPQLEPSKLSWNVIFGTDTRVYIHVDRVSDPYARYFYAYVDGVQVLWVTIGSAGYEGTLNLGNYQEDTRHKLELAITYGAYVENGWKVVSLRVHTSTPKQSLFKDGLYLPKNEPSNLIFDIYFQSATGTLYFLIQRDQDTYARTFRIYLDGTKIYERTIGTKIDDEVAYSTTVGTHKIMVQISYGALVDYGWKLMDLGLSGGYISGVYFPKINPSKLTWNIICGSESQVYIHMDAIQDPYARYFYVYVDGVQKYFTIIGGSFDGTVSLGSYTTRTVHKLTLSIDYGAYSDYGWKLTSLKPNYAALFVEIDYMFLSTAHNHMPQTAALTYISNYYIDHGYERVTFQVDDAVAHRDWLSFNDYFTLYANVWFDHQGNNLWKYVLYGHYCAEGTGILGWTNAVSGQFIFIADQACDDYAGQLGVPTVRVEKVVDMHEIGHSINIIDLSGGNEVYDSYAHCVMAMASIEQVRDEYQYYCPHHWSERQYP